MDAVVKGFRAPLSGIRFLFAHPRLVRYFAVPVAINTASYIAVAYVFFANLSALLHWIFGDATVWYMQILFYAAGLVIGGLFALVLLFTFTAVGMILAGPFLDVLSQKVDEIRLGRDPVPSGGSLVEDILRSLAGQVRKIVLFLLIQGLLLLVYLIPVIGQIAGAPLQAGVTFFFLAWEFWDFPMERRKMNFRAKREFLLRHKAQALSFGAVCFLYMLVPVLNFIMMPASVAGATVLVSDLLGESSGARAT